MSFIAPISIAVFVIFTAGLAGRELPRFPAGLPLYIIIGVIGAVASVALAIASKIPLYLAIPYGAGFLMVETLSYAVLGEMKRPSTASRPVIHKRELPVIPGHALRLSQMDPTSRPTVVGKEVP